MSRVLVTGAGGFIGRHVIARLNEAGCDVHAVVRNREAVSDLRGARIHEADLLDNNAVSDAVAAACAQQLVHLAWCSTVDLDAPDHHAWIAATTALLGAFAAGGGRRAVLAGTCAEYDWNAPGSARTGAGGWPAYTEADAALVPLTQYGRAKRATRLEAERIADEAGIEVAWARIFFIYGPGERRDRLVASASLSLLRGEPVLVSDGDQLRDYLHAADVAAALDALLASDLTGAINVASGEPVTVRGLVERLAQSAARSELVRCGAVPRAPGDPEVLLADVSRLRDELAFAPQVPLDDGLRDVLDWWREHPA